MDKYELLCWLLQDLRDNPEPDEADIGPAILRETTKIDELMIQHGHLTRDMFDLTGISDPSGEASVPRRYAHYQTTNYPITFVVFAESFAEWLLGKDDRERLSLVDLIEMFKETSWLQVKITSQVHSSLVVVRTQKHSTHKLHEQVLVAS